MPMPVSTWVEVDLDRFAANLRAIRGAIGAERELLLVAKADAYGHGAVEMARRRRARGRRPARRRDAARGHPAAPGRLPRCRSWRCRRCCPAEIAEAVAHGIDPTVGDLEFARALSAAAARAGRPVRFHVEVDTGMGRIGVREEDAVEFVAEVAALPGLRLASVYTHFPGRRRGGPDFAHGQVARFGAIARAARRARPPAAARARLEQRRHGEPARGALRPGARRAHRLRPPPAARRARACALAPVMSFKSRLVQVRDLPAGTPISYGAHVRHRAAEPHRRRAGRLRARLLVAAVEPRRRCWCAGRRVPIVGRVTMDLTMVDLTDVPGVRGGRRGRALRRTGRRRAARRGGRRAGARRLPTR